MQDQRPDSNNVGPPAAPVRAKTVEHQPDTSDSCPTVALAAEETVPPLDALVASSPTVGDVSSGSSDVEPSPTPKVPEPATAEKLPIRLASKMSLFIGSNGQAFGITKSANGHPRAVGLRSRQIKRLIRKEAAKEGNVLRERDVDDIIEHLAAHAELAGEARDVFYRVAPYAKDGIRGIELDLGDEAGTRARITPGKVEVFTSGSSTLFYLTPVSKPLVLPAEHGNYQLLKKFVSLDDIDFLLLVAWITYTLAHPKVPTSKFVILVCKGDYGSGKSTVTRLVLMFTDPSLVGVQVFPGKVGDLSIMSQNAHVLAFDNTRSFSRLMADALCIASTGGSISARQLYTDDGQFVTSLHVAMMLNGIHEVIREPDLAQRCLTIRTQPIQESERKSDAVMAAELAVDAPVIFRGLLDLIAQCFLHLPEVEITNPARMIDFVRWLGAMERAHELPAGIYQSVYAESLREAQLASLQENVLASAVMDFAKASACPTWTGTPQALFKALYEAASMGTSYSDEWPRNAIALSKRLNGLKASLEGQGVKVQFGRGKERTITIINNEYTANALENSDVSF